MAYLIDMITDQRKQSKANQAGGTSGSRGTGSFNSNLSSNKQNVGSNWSNKSQRNNSPDSSAGNPAGNQAAAGSSGFADSQLGSFNGVSQGNSITGNMNLAGKTTKIFATSGDGSSLNYGPSNIQSGSNREKEPGGTVSQSEAKSFDSSCDVDSQFNKSAAGIVSGGGTSMGNENKIGSSRRSNALKRSTRASLKNRGQ